jgi:hypothetical protein
MSERNLTDPAYVMGCSAEEMMRLQKQYLLYNPSTRRLIEEAGITTGMKVHEMSEDEDRQRAGDALRKQLVRDVDALTEAGPGPIPVEGVCTGEEDARGIVDPLKAKR